MAQFMIAIVGLAAFAPSIDHYMGAREGRTLLQKLFQCAWRFFGVDAARVHDAIVGVPKFIECVAALLAMQEAYDEALQTQIEKLFGNSFYKFSIQNVKN